LLSACARPHPSKRTHRPFLPRSCTSPAPARRLRSPTPLHIKTPPMAAPPLDRTIPCAPPALAPTPPHRRAAHCRITRPGWAEVTRRVTRDPFLPRPHTPPNPTRRLRSPPPRHSNAPPISALPRHATNPRAPPALAPFHPHKDAVHRCPSPARHQPLRAQGARTHPAPPARRPSLPCPCTPPTPARRLGSPPPLHTKTPLIAAPPLHASHR